MPLMPDKRALLVVGPGQHPIRRPLFLPPPTVGPETSWRREWKCEEPRACPLVEEVRVDELTRAEAPVGGPRRAGESPSFEDLFTREFPRVARTIHHIVGDRPRAEEVTQDAFLELLRNWRTVASYDRPDLWVRRVAIRKAQRERHRAWRRVELERSTVGEESMEPPTPAPEVLAAVRRLAPRQRAVVVLFYF